MIVLTLGNSYSNVSGLSTAQERALKGLLSYEDKVYGGYGSRPPKRCLLGRKGDFPSGLRYIVERYLAGCPESTKVVDSRKVPIPQRGMFSIQLPFQPRNDQMRAVDACLKNETGAISMPTGTGKSVTMALLINALQMRVLVVVPNLELKRQLTASFKEYFGDLKNITVENIDSSSLDSATGYDVLILDEAHHSAAATYRKLNKKAWTGIYHRYFFTATPFRSRDEEQLLMESITGQVVHRLAYEEAVSLKAIVPIEAYYIEVPNTVPEGDTHSWPAMYSELVVKNKQRNLKIQELLLKLNASGVSTLCLVKEIAHGNTLSADGAFSFANGQDGAQDLIDAFNSGVINPLIGTNGVLAEGVDTKRCEFVIIAGLGKSKNLLMQSFGRAVRAYPGKESAKVILVKDLSHKWTKAHFKEQCKVLKDEYGVVPIKLDL